MKEKPRKANAKFMSPFLISRIVVPAFLKSMIILILFFTMNNAFGSAVATTMAFITLSFAELLFAFVIRSDRKSILSIGLFTNPQLLIGVTAIVLVQLCVIFIPSIGNIFDLVPLNTTLYVASIGAAIGYMIIAEIAKQVIAKAFKVK